MATPTSPNGHAKNIYQMMDRLGIERGANVVPQLCLIYATAFQRCDTCLNKEACSAWLAERPGAVALAPPFCAIADIFFELQLDPASYNSMQ